MVCNKASCKHCERIFESKNQLHEHLRSRECQQLSPIKSKASHKSSLLSLIIAESTTSSTECVTSSSPSALSEYRAVSPSSSTYETASKNYLTVTNLYMRYASLKSVVFSRIRHSLITYFRIVLLTLTVKNLYKKFYEKENSVISAVKWTPAHRRQIGFSAVKSAYVTKTSTIDSNLVPHKGAKTRFFTQTKTSAQRLNSQQQPHMTIIFFASSRAIVYDYRRRHSRRFEACCWWRRRSRWIWSYGEALGSKALCFLWFFNDQVYVTFIFSSSSFLSHWRPALLDWLI